MERRTKLVCTIGPATDTPEMIEELIRCGMDVARLNFSHGTHQEHLKRVEIIRKAAKKLSRHVAIMLDTKGPEIRTGDLQAPQIWLKKNNKLILTTEQILGNENKLSINYDNLPEEINVGEKILLDDGLISLKVLEKNEKEITCLIENDGDIKSKRGVNIPGKFLSMPFLSVKDIEDIGFALEHSLDYIALSFVREAADIRKVKKIIADYGSDIRLIAKIENVFAVKNIEEIVEVADAVMVARGDLGVEIPIEEIPVMQKKIIAICLENAKPVITATQMLDSMIRNPRPTRAEVTDVANAILDGTDAVMLSGESASGNYPLESCETIVRISKETEKILKWEENIFKARKYKDNNPITDNISMSAVKIAEKLDASAIIVPTSSGFTARMVSKYRPLTPIIATVWDEKVGDSLALVWGVTSIKIGFPDNTDAMIEKSVEAAIEAGYLQKGDLVVVTAGIPCAVSGKTNLIKIHIA